MYRRKGSGTAPRAGTRKKNLGKYKSLLEKYCAERLQQENLEFAYEGKEYVLQESFHYNGVYYKMTKGSKDLVKRSNSHVLPIKYTPDFVGINYNFVIETKGFIHEQHTFQLRWKMYLDYLCKSGEPVPALFLPKNKQQVDEAINIILDLIADGQIETIGDVRHSHHKNGRGNHSSVRKPSQRKGRTFDDEGADSGQDF